MAKTFNGVTVKTATVLSYYPNPNFDHFVFQQSLDLATAANNDYTLTAFAVAAGDVVLNGGASIPVDPINGSPFHLSKKISSSQI